MPRANRYIVPGQLYHLTHRCHDRQFLLKFARDRDQYRQLLWSRVRSYPISVFAYCLTCNHTHLLLRSESSEAVSQWMQEVEGEFAQSYNRRKGRSGAFWSDRYHCTMVEGGQYLWNCMVYIELNMVRAGVVPHPAQWPWCSYQEWMGLRHRYGVVDQKGCLSFLGGGTVEEFRTNYQEMIRARLAKDQMEREPEWTESIAVGSREFAEAIARGFAHRQFLECRPLGGGTWILKESLGGT